MNWSYIAGFFDGEGSITLHGLKHYRVTVAQTNEEVLKEIKNFVERGYVIEVRKRRAHWKDNWVYYIAKQEDIYYFLTMIAKYLIVKRALARKTLARLKIWVKNKKIRMKKSGLISKRAKELRKRGLTYREIGKCLNIDFGHARRIILKP